MSSIASAPVVGIMTEEAKRQRYRELAAKMGRSKLEVKGRPDRHYFWADMNDTNGMIQIETLGYSIVREPDAVAVLAGKAKAKIAANFLKPDGTFNNGDVILTECDIEVYEMIMAYNAERHEQMAIGAQRDFRQEAEKFKVPVFDKNA